MELRPIEGAMSHEQLTFTLLLWAFSCAPTLSYYRGPLPAPPSWQGPPLYGPPSTFMYYVQQGKTKTGYKPLLRPPAPPPPPPPVCPPEEPPPYEKIGPPFVPYCDFSKDNFCDYVDYYPAKLIDYLFRRGRIDVKSLLNEGEPPARTTPPPQQYPRPPAYPSQTYQQSYPQYGQYNSSSAYYPPSDNGNYGSERGRHKRQAGRQEELCDTDVDERVPMAARAVNGKTYFVVNGGLGLGSDVQSNANTKGIQTVTVRQCSPSQRFRACRLQPYCTPTSATSSVCVQQEGQLKLLVLEQNGDQLALRPFRFWSGCVCTFTRS